MLKINPLGSFNNPYQKQSASQRANAAGTNKTERDKVEISQTAKQMQSGETNIRQEKIDALKQKVEAGTHQVDAEKAAKKFMDFWTGK
ncbi:anti-sigma-28 factor, FlgM family [Alteribacillus persepolensis]|uniref:Negative regulator of flagellin synthesis n=1 Tax=Alteribacillus persepolensis TaxID=568899 RepID=A0A1G8AES0_9BACI|nr:flagellar biosynthesis anti-sigma factor FlgM [Alteribacillus persepolensis]SDH19438.1 anti-sigma-28 factor, FlgM family [Alteribacillus persepolensis]